MSRFSRETGPIGDYWKWKSLSCVQLFATLWTTQSMEFSRPEWILEWVAIPFYRGSSQPRDQTQVSHIAGEFFTSWATREAQEYWSRKPIPSSVALPDPGIKPGSPALKVDSLPAGLLGKPDCNYGGWECPWSAICKLETQTCQWLI